MKFTKQHTPRWIIFCIDICIILFSFGLAYLLRFNFNVPEKEFVRIPYAIPFVITVRATSFWIGKTFAGIVRYTSTSDAQRIFTTISLGSSVFLVANFLIHNILGFELRLIPISIVIIDLFIAVFLMTAFRIVVKTLFINLKRVPTDQKSVVIFGAGEAGLITKRAMDKDGNASTNVIAFVDDADNKKNNKLEGVKIHLTSNLDSILANNKVDFLIIAVQNFSPIRRREIIETCLKHKVKIMSVPPVQKWINGELSFNQIKQVNIEDLLERPAINLSQDKIKTVLTNKTILVTGAAGSIGSELVRQISNFHPKKLIILDQAESPLYDIEMEMLETAPKLRMDIVIADIRDKHRVQSVFNEYNPQIIFHAAAYKHVPMMEGNPYEAIFTNIIGTRILADLANKNKVENFVMVSTDKAVNPTNVMGASKRTAEIYVQALSKSSNTKFVTTRFGNVLGSNGSVIPRFKKQIDEGGPITVTHPDITRFFMTIPEACQLVLEAGAMGKGGEVFVFDMGKSVKIADLAKKMVKLSGLELGRDIELKFTGLRPGEKLYEELLTTEENTIPTHHEKIMKAKVRETELKEIESSINNIESSLEAGKTMELVKQLKAIIPEYKSKNSVFEVLD